MKVVILAAGSNSRIANVASGLPKTLLKINDTELLKIILNGLIDINVIEEIIIVIGYKSDLIKKSIKYKYKGKKISYIYNFNYGETNSMFSLWLTKKYIKNEILIINGDTIFPNTFLNNFIKIKSRSLIYVDKNYKKLCKEDLKVLINNNDIAIKIGKNISINNNTYGSPAIYIFRKNDLVNFFNIIENDFIKKNKCKYLISKAVNVFASRYELNAYSPSKKYFWIEIDNSKDFNYAKKMYKKLA